MKKPIPTLFYHSLGVHKNEKPWSFLTMPPSLFEMNLKYLHKNKYYFAVFDEVYRYVKGEIDLPDKTVFLHFDDGFLDNFVVAWPIAKKYGARFTVFVSPDFVDPRPVVRQTVEVDSPNGYSVDGLDWWGYCSWDELRLMQSSGVVDVQSHAMTHTWYPTSGKIVDFHHPGDSYFWLNWNRNRKQKPFWLEKYQEEFVPYGAPVYEHAKALVARVYHPCEDLERAVCEYVAQNGGRAFFDKSSWREDLVNYSKRVRLAGGKGRLETLEEQEERQRYELAESKDIIEKNLNKPVDFLAWPGGGSEERMFALALDVGYRGTTNGRVFNRPGGNPSRNMRRGAHFGTRAPLLIQQYFFRAQLDFLSNRKSIFSMGLSLLKACRHY